MCLLNCLRSKDTLKQGKVFEFLKRTAEPMLLENLKGHGKSWNLKSARPRVILASIDSRERVTV